jgi:hypothetical protein
VKLVRRWLPDCPIKLIGDGAYSVVELGTVCREQQVTLITPLPVFIHHLQHVNPVKWDAPV